MRTVRIIDRGSAQQHGLVPIGTAVSKRVEDEPGKPSVDEKRAYYWSGPGWLSAYTEARRLMATGLSIERVAPQVGWSKEELEDAIRRNGKPPEIDPNAVDEFKPRERPRRTVKQRVAGLHGVSKETQELARRYYEVEVMTVREVAKALGEPYEKTYLILILAKTKFRRPGRRGAADAEPRRPAPTSTVAALDSDDEPVKKLPAITTENEPRRPVRKLKSKKATRRGVASADEIRKAFRRVLGPKALVDIKPPIKKRKRASSASRLSEVEKARRRVLG